MSYGRDSTVFRTNKYVLTIDSYLLDHPLLLYPGISIQYSYPFFSKGFHHFCYGPTLGFVSVPNVETRWLMGAGVHYTAKFTKRFFAGAELNGYYILTKLDYDRYEYDGQGNFVNQGRFLHRVAPGFALNFGWDIVRREKYQLGLLFQTRVIRFDKSYTNKFLEGFKQAFSLGVSLNI